MCGCTVGQTAQPLLALAWMPSQLAQENPIINHYEECTTRHIPIFEMAARSLHSSVARP